VSIDYERWTQTALRGDELPRADTVTMLTNPRVDIFRMATAAGDVRMATFGKKVKIHKINNIQNGLCPEDCGYCGQSKVSKAPIKRYPMKDEDDIVQEARDAKANGVYRYCMVSGGRGPTQKKTKQLARIIKRINDEVGIRTCLSVGIVNLEKAKLFKAAGLDRLNHNLNTSETHTPKIVSTHTYQDRIDTLIAAKEAGLQTCSGMIAGMGESDEDILNVAHTLRRMKVPSIPINFLVPIHGNPIYDFNQLTPERCLRILCMFRFVNPTAEIRIGGGREGHLRGLQSLALYPANSLFVDGYLVTRGDQKNKVYQMVKDAGFELEGEVDETPMLSVSERFTLDDDPNIMNPKTAWVD
jgi:biotin synthase